MKKLIIISGPTATGKTAQSIDLAIELIKQKKLVTIVNFDSLLFYRELNIGTAKPSMEERRGIPHSLIDVASVAQPINAADFTQMALDEINRLHQAGHIVILVGGSAFYLRALLKGMYQSVKESPQLKMKLADLISNKGIAGVIDELKRCDTEILNVLHPNDHYRLSRALLHFWSTNSKLSIEKEKTDALDPYDFEKHIRPWDILHFYLDLPKDEHFKIIEKRTRQMIDNGLLKEVSELKDTGIDMHLKPMQSIGIKEMAEYLNGDFKTIEECIERISISTRQLAKSQRTFFNKIKPKINCHPILDRQKVIDLSFEFLNKI
jgi:tRNA dimethylallyltransferase